MRQRRRFAFVSTLAIATAVTAGPALAGSNATSLPDGTELTVTIDEPIDGAELLVPPGTPSIDVAVTGTASIGTATPDTTFIYVMDVSGSTGTGSGTGCSPVLECEKVFMEALNEALVATGYVSEVGLVVFAGDAAAADMSPDPGEQPLVAPDIDGSVDAVIMSAYAGGGLNLYTPRLVGVSTDFAAGLQATLAVVSAATTPNVSVVFVSDGQAFEGAAEFPGALASIVSSGAAVDTIALGTGNSCDGTNPNGTLQQIADATGGDCFQVEDPADLTGVIDSLIESSILDQLTISVNGGSPTTVTNADVEPDLPAPGPIAVSYTTALSGLAPGDHEICVAAYGSDGGGAGSVTTCVTIHLLTFDLTPLDATNELSYEDSHAVTATVIGDPAHVSTTPRTVTFVVAGTNPQDPSGVVTGPGGDATYTYGVPREPASLGTDTISATTLIGGETVTLTALKHWVDLVPPQAACPATTNPAGKTIPRAPGKGGQGQNQDGFFELVATDAVWGSAGLEVYVTDDGSGTVFGPFEPGTRIKWTEANGATPSIKKMGSDRGKAGAVSWHITGKGDAVVTAVDDSGNEADAASCLVPPFPK